MILIIFALTIILIIQHYLYIEKRRKDIKGLRTVVTLLDGKYKDKSNDQVMSKALYELWSIAKKKPEWLDLIDKLDNSKSMVVKIARDVMRKEMN